MRWQDRRRRARFLPHSRPRRRELADRAGGRRTPVAPGLEPSTVDGRYLISVVAMRHEGELRYGQINIRTYVEHAGEQAVYFLVTRVTLPGLVGVLMGAPFAPSRISVARGAVDAPGLGISLRYDVGEETRSGPLGRPRARDLRKGSAEGVPDSPRAGGLAPRGAGRAVARRPARRLRARARRAGRGRRLCRRGPARARERPEELRLPTGRGKIEVP